jgi:hypothetical protein
MGSIFWRRGRVLVVASLTLSGLLAGLAGAGPAAAAEGGAVSGTVTDNGGTPIAGICVEAQDRSTYRSTTTDADGHYRIALGVTGDYTVTFGCYNGPWVRESYDDQSAFWAGDRIRIADGQEVSGIDAALARAGQVRGRITDSAGAPVSGVWAYVSSDTGMGGNGTTGPDGTYVINGLAPGSYVAYSSGGYYGGDQTAPRHFVVASGRVRSGIDFQQRARGTISGTVVDETGAPLAGICVAAEDGVHPTYGFGWAQTDATGRYTMTDVPEGSHVVAFNTCWDESHESEFYDGVMHPSAAQRVTVHGGQDVAGIDAVLSDGAVVTGTITDANGGPLAGICVSAAPLPSDYLTHRYRSTTTDAAGNYRLAGVSQGDYVVHARSCSSSPSELLPRYYGGEPGGVQDSEGAPVPVDGTNPVSGIDIQLVSGGAIEGTVTGAGQPLGGLCVIAAERGAPWLRSWAGTDANGHYRVTGLRAADQDVAFFACTPAFQDYVSEWHHDARREADATPIPVTLGATTTGVDEDLAQAATISGTITAAGRPVAACAFATRDGAPSDGTWEVLGDFFSAPTDSSGSYSLRGLPAGTYRVLLRPCQSDAGWAAQWFDGAADEASATPVEVTEGQHVTGVDAALQPAPPKVLGITPESASQGAVMAVVGLNLRGATEVRFGDMASPRVIPVSRNEVDAEVPAGVLGTTVDITVVGPGGVSEVVPAGRFTFEAPPPPPAVATVTPDHGPVRGGNNVTVAGDHLTGTNAVRFGAASASFVVLDDGTIDATVPPAATLGPVDLTITTNTGTSAPVTYTYEAPPGPVVTSLSPDHGPMNQSTLVVIDGTALGNATSVRFGDQQATFWPAGGTSLRAWSPLSPASGPVDVVVTTPDGVSDPAVFTYDPPVFAVSAISPDHGPLDGGQWVDIFGSGFASAAEVRFGDTVAAYSVWDDHHMIATSPPAAGPGPVALTVFSSTGSSASATYTYDPPPPPTVYDLVPDHGPLQGGNEIELYGWDLGDATEVRFGDTAADFVVLDDTVIHAVVPPGAEVGLVDVVVTGPTGSSAPVQYRYDEPPAKPTVSSVTPSSGPMEGGTIVTISGEHLGTADAVLFGTTPADFGVLDDGTLIATTPPTANAGLVDVRVHSPGGTSDATDAAVFEYRARPVVAALTPDHGPPEGGTPVTITGGDFRGASEVFFGPNPASFTVESPDTITAVAPPGTGLQPVVVRTIGGWNEGGPAFDYLAPPTVTNVSPAVGPAEGGTTVIIEGSDFTDAGTVSFGDVAATFSVVSDGRIEATTPPHASGVIAVTVTNGVGSATMPDSFRYIDKPVVTSVTPSSGPFLGGTGVTVSGIDFVDVLSVALVDQGLVGTTRTPVDFAVQPDGAVTFTTPPHLPATVGIEVTTRYGTSPASAAASFTYRLL